jgi:YesN/AraC family two-component response regulator
LQQSTHEKPIVVLIVEDEALIRMDVADYISRPDITTLEAANADEALQILSERSDVDVIFTDVNMPGSMDGLQLAERVRELQSEIGIIIASGMVRVARSTLPSNIVFYEKPYDLEEVSASIRKLAHAA